MACVLLLVLSSVEGQKQRTGVELAPFTNVRLLVSIFWFLVCFQQLAHSLSQVFLSRPLFSAACGLFCKIPGVYPYDELRYSTVGLWPEDSKASRQGCRRYPGWRDELAASVGLLICVKCATRAFFRAWHWPTGEWFRRKAGCRRNSSGQRGQWALGGAAAGKSTTPSAEW
jgi:hypothetical protein